MAPKRVLIAHQSTIPHYRVAFYNLLNRIRPADWTFDVVYDVRESQRPTIYLEKVDSRTFQFPILDAKTSSLTLGGRRLLWQHFWRRAKHYDVLVTDTHLSNLTYPALLWHQFRGRKRVLWGHVRDMNRENPGRVKKLVESIKGRYIKSADGFLAYTNSGHDELRALGYPSERIVVLNNTIDIDAERATFLRLRAHRNRIRDELGFAGKKVIVYAGRLVEGKRIGYLLDAFRLLYRLDAGVHLAIVGSGALEGQVKSLRDELGTDAVSVFGAVTDPEQLGRILTASDRYVIPGYVGLAPLQAICYGLMPIYFALPFHSPEVEYLNPGNSWKLPAEMPAEELAGFMENSFLQSTADDEAFRSISHLTLESMANHFAEGIARALGMVKP